MVLMLKVGPMYWDFFVKKLPIIRVAHPRESYCVSTPPPPRFLSVEIEAFVFSPRHGMEVSFLDNDIYRSKG